MTADQAAPTSPLPPTGEQVRIAHGDQEAWTVAVAAGLRSYAVAGRELVDGFPAGERPTGGRGQTLVPWPNRIAGARYEFDGVEQQLPVTENATGNAIHGLGRWATWAPVERSGASVTWQLLLPPQPGWPTSLLCRVTYALGDDGLTVTKTATNTGSSPCPYGAGSHPYLRAAGKVDAMTLRVPAATWYETDDAGIPLTSHPVDDEHDWREARPIGDRVVDHCYGDLQRDADGRWRVVVADDGHELTLWGDRTHGWVQLFSGDTLPEDQRRHGLAIEPMTCPPNAFNTGEGVVRLEPGESHTALWGLTTT